MSYTIRPGSYSLEKVHYEGAVTRLWSSWKFWFTRVSVDSLCNFLSFPFFFFFCLCSVVWFTVLYYF